MATTYVKPPLFSNAKIGASKISRFKFRAAKLSGQLFLRAENCGNASYVAIPRMATTVNETETCSHENQRRNREGK